MIHKCSYCDYQSPYKGNLKTHVKNKHGNNSAPSTISIGEDGGRPPNVQYGIQTLHCESGPAQVYNSTPNTVSIEDYNKVAESAHGWKNAYHNLNNQTGSGINTEDVHKHAVESIRNWEEAYQNLDVQKNAALQQLFNQTREMENLPIIINKNSATAGILSQHRDSQFLNPVLTIPSC